MVTCAPLLKHVPHWPYWPGVGGVVGITINALVQPDAFTGAWPVMMAALNLACLFLIPHFPVLIWAGYLVLFLLISVNAELHAAAFVFIAPVLAGIITYEGHKVASIMGGILLWYIGSTDIPAGILFPSDVLASTVWASFLILSMLIGHVLQRIVAQREMLTRQWELDMQTRKEIMARTLHDSVASSLTSVIMHAEKLGLRGELSDSTHVELTAIIEQARIAMQEVRRLLEVLNDNPKFHSASSAPSVAQQWENATRRLKTHGFRVTATGIGFYPQLSDENLSILQEILTELITNIIKYGAPESLVILSFENQEGQIKFRLENSISTAYPGPLLSTGMGVPSVSHLTQSLGGYMRVISDPDRWVTEIVVPL